MTYNIKILRIWITIIRHGGLSHEVQESWPYLSNATPWPYELSHVSFFFIFGRPHFRLTSVAQKRLPHFTRCFKSALL